jgi:hypothetical protein
MGGLFGGGGGASAPAPMDYNAMADSGMKATLKYYPQIAAQQLQYNPYFSQQALGQVNNVAALLSGDPSQQYNLTPVVGKGGKVTGLTRAPIGMSAGNDYTKRADNVINETMSRGTNALIDTGNRINALGDQSSAVASAAQQRALAGPTSIEQNLYNQAASDLALGSQLNPEEARAASQQASSAYAMRGLGTGNSAAAADLLNRYQYGQARLQQRQQAASGANQLMEAGMNNRATTASGLLGNSANLYGQAGGAYQNAAQLGYGGASALVNLDPMQRAMGTGVNLGTSTNGQTGQMIGNMYSQNLQMAGDVASANYNGQMSQYNSQQNNKAALLGAGIGAVGQIGGAIGMGVAL